MKNLLKKWNESSLVLRILGGLIIGVVLGLAVPQAAPIGLLGRLWAEGYSTFDKGGSVSAIYCGPVEV